MTFIKSIKDKKLNVVISRGHVNLVTHTAPAVVGTLYELAFVYNGKTKYCDVDNLKLNPNWQLPAQLMTALYGVSLQKSV